MKKLFLFILLVALMPTVASARYHGSHGSSVSVDVGYGGYSDYDYYPAPAYYEPYPVYSEPVYVERQVVVERPVAIEQVRPYNTYARPTHKRRDNKYCREFQRDVQIDGRVQQSYGTACRQPDGSWQMVR